MTSVHHDRQLHDSSSALVDQSIECSADRAAGEENVVDQDDDLAVDVEGDVGDGLGQVGLRRLAGGGRSSR